MAPGISGVSMEFALPSAQKTPAPLASDGENVYEFITVRTCRMSPAEVLPPWKAKSMPFGFVCVQSVHAA